MTWLKNRSYWFKGSILFFGFVLIVFFILFLIGDRWEIGGGLFSLPVWFVFFYPGILLFEPNNAAGFLILSTSILFYLLLGALLGAIWGWKKGERIISQSGRDFLRNVFFKKWWGLLIILLLLTAIVIPFLRLWCHPRMTINGPYEHCHNFFDFWHYH